MTENPVISKELKVRLRMRQTGPVRWAMLAMSVMLVLFLYQQGFAYLANDPSPGAGRTAWQIGLFLQTTLIWLLCPALAANAITQEREQQTWEMLIFTLLTPMEILTGKLIARLVPVAALLAAFVPFMVICMSRGGATVVDLLVAYLVFVIWVLFLVTVSLFMSWAFRKTAAAIAMSYVVLFALTLGTALLEATLAVGRIDPDTPIIWLNPFRVAAALLNQDDPNGTRVILFSSLSFLVMTGFLFWRMVRQFRAFATE
jgi:ABC-type transport system involved in multi-copper enzyme maturation permease subunit